jgi:hypothetical protein
VAALRAALGDDAARVEFRDSVDWYRSPEYSLASYTRYLDEHLGRGVPRVRVVAEVIWPQRSAASEVAGWKHYRARVFRTLARTRSALSRVARPRGFPLFSQERVFDICLLLAFDPVRPWLGKSADEPETGLLHDTV